MTDAVAAAERLVAQSAALASEIRQDASLVSSPVSATSALGVAIRLSPPMTAVPTR